MRLKINKWTRLLGILVVFTSIACEEEGVINETPDIDGNVIEQAPHEKVGANLVEVENEGHLPSFETGKFLPYGVSIPEGTRLTAIPEPYDPAAHGPATRNPFEFNEADSPNIPRTLALRHGFRKGKDGKPTPPPGNGDRGFFINDGAGSALYVLNDVQDNLVIPYNSSTNDQVIYSPTHQAGGGSCVETVTVHWRPANSSTTYHAHGFWDWCRSSPGWGSYESMNSTWKAAYARGSSSDPYYATMVMKSGSDCWNGYLYNYSTGTWDLKLSSCGTTKTGWGNTGWTMWESWNLVGCPTLPRIKAQNVTVVPEGGTWTRLTSAYSSQLGPSSGSCFATGSYGFSVIQPNYTWEGLTP